MESRTPRRSRRRANVQKKTPTALIREHDVGVKWKIQRRMPKAANRLVVSCRLRPHVFVCKVILQIPSGAITGRKWVLGVQVNPVLESRKLRAGHGSCMWETKMIDTSRKSFIIIPLVSSDAKLMGYSQLPLAKFKIEDACAQFSELLERARAGEEILITKDQKPHARLLPPTLRTECTHAGDEGSAVKSQKPVEEYWSPTKRRRRKKAPLKHLDLPDLFDDEYPKQAVTDTAKLNDNR